MATDSKTFLDDKESLRALIRQLSIPAQAEYADYKSLNLEAAFPGRKMVTYSLKGGKPIDIDFISFRDFICDREFGPTADIQIGDELITVSTTPRKLGRLDVFMHIPQNFTLKYKGKAGSGAGVDFVSHYAVLVKTRSSETYQTDGHTYCVTLNKFRERFPGLKIRY